MKTTDGLSPCPKCGCFGMGWIPGHSWEFSFDRFIVKCTEHGECFAIKLEQVP